MHLACDQRRLYTLPYVMLYVRVFIGHVGRNVDIHCTLYIARQDVVLLMTHDCM